MPEPAHTRQLTSTVYATPLMTPTTALGLFIRTSMSELRETGDWNIFLGPPERARAETGGADQSVLKRRKLPGFARVNKVTSASPGHPSSVFNKKLFSQTYDLRHPMGFIGCLRVKASYEFWPPCNDLPPHSKTATPCNTLQHTATPCSALQHAATHSNTL